MVTFEMYSACALVVSRASRSCVPPQAAKLQKRLTCKTSALAAYLDA